MPKRKDFGEEGPEGDAKHALVMQGFSVREFGNTQIQGSTLDDHSSRLGLFGHWLQENMYGKHFEWTAITTKDGPRRMVVAVKGQRLLGEAAVMEYALVMATGDVESRPKGGRKEYRNGAHAKVVVHGKKSGDLMGAQKEFGSGCYADAPFRYCTIAETVKSIRWFYDALLEAQEGQGINPASKGELDNARAARL